MLQTLQRKHSNCTLVVTDPTGITDGYLYIQDGDVVAAALDGVTGVDAATAMIIWEEPEIAVYALPQRVIANVPPDARATWLSAALVAHRPTVRPPLPAASTRTATNYVVVPNIPIEYATAPAAPVAIPASAVDADRAPSNEQKEHAMAQVNNALAEMMTIEGAMSAALVDWTSGMALGSISNGMNIEVAAAGNANLVRAQHAMLRALGVTDGIEDVLITLDDQYHLIRALHTNANLFMYLVLNRAQSNLAMARYRLGQIEHVLVV